MSTAPRIAAAKRDWGHDEVGCTVLHIDMDAFFASLEVARHPEYADKPVIIGIGNRSVVSAANYEARKYGINSAMASSRARKLCPNGVFLPVDIHYYREMSRRIFTEVFSRVTDRIEQVSVDECYMDVSGALLRWKSPRAIGAWIRDQVARRYHITEFVQMMPLRGIPGIGPSLEKRLNAWGVDSVADLAKMSMESLEQATGSAISARGLYMAARGLDDRPVAPRAQEKSVGAERTFDKDTQDMRQVTSMLRWCCDDVAGTLRRRGLMARKVMVKLRFPDLSYATKGHTLDCPTDAASMLYPQCVALLLAMMGMPESSIDAISLTRPVRLAGMSAGGLVEAADAAVQLSLDDMLEEQNEAQRGRGTDTEPSTQSERLRGAEAALDAVRLKYGKGSVRLGIWRTGPSGNLEH